MPRSLHKLYFDTDRDRIISSYAWVISLAGHDTVDVDIQYISTFTLNDGYATFLDHITSSALILISKIVP